MLNDISRVQHSFVESKELDLVEGESMVVAAEAEELEKEEGRGND